MSPIPRRVLDHDHDHDYGWNVFRVVKGDEEVAEGECSDSYLGIEHTYMEAMSLEGYGAGREGGITTGVVEQAGHEVDSVIPSCIPIV